MAYRQYIGARYVPLYMGNWDASQNYEPLTVVDDANGNSYTSKKDVPAGTPLTNRDYWIQTSSFSGAITQLQNRMNAAEDSIDELETWKADETRRKCSIMIGDSYDKSLSFYPELATMLGYEANEYVALSKNAYGFTGINQAGGKFIDLLRNSIATLPFDKNDVELIVVAGGLNDCGITTYEAITTAIGEFVAYCKEQFPNATVKIGFIGVWMKILDSTDMSTNARVYSMAIPAYKDCVAFGAEYLNGVEWIFFNRKRLQANLNHPIVNAEQRKWCASKLYEAIKTGSVEVVEGCACAFVGGTGYTAGVAFSGLLERRGSRFTFYNQVNVAGLLNVKANEQKTIGGTINLDNCMTANNLTVLPPKTNAAAYSGSKYQIINVYTEATSAFRGAVAGQVLFDLSADDAISIDVTGVTYGGAASGTFIPLIQTNTGVALKIYEQ